MSTLGQGKIEEVRICNSCDFLSGDMSKNSEASLYEFSYSNSFNVASSDVKTIANSKYCSSGTAVVQSSGTLKLENVEFVNNSRGMFLENTVLEGNSVTFTSQTSGGIVQNGGNMRLSNASFVGNVVRSSGTNKSVVALGGAVLKSGGLLEITSGTFAKNGASAYSIVSANTSAFAYGGAVLLQNGDLKLQAVRFLSNNVSAYADGKNTTSLDGSSYASGGAVAGSYGSMTFNSVDFLGNYASACADVSAYAYGGGVAMKTGSMLLSSTIFASNYVSAYSFYDKYARVSAFGGAMSIQSGTVDVLKTTFENNKALASASGYNPLTCAKGGGIYQISGNMVCDNGIFTSNIASAKYAQGGAIYHSNGSIQMNDVTFSGNSAYGYGSISGGFCSGGAINKNGGNMKIASASFIGNVASAFGDGPGDGYSYGGTINIENAEEMFISSAKFSRNLAAATGDGSCYGGAVNAKNVERIVISSAGFYENIALASGYKDAASAYGGAVNAAGCKDVEIDTVVFRNNSVYGSNVLGYGARGYGAYGGAVYVDGGVIKFTNTVFLENKANSGKAYGYGGAIYLADGCMGTYTVTNGMVVENIGNNASCGGFLYLGLESKLTFCAQDSAKIIIGSSSLATDSIAGTGTLLKTGNGTMTIHSDISGFLGQWRIVKGRLELLSRARSMSLDNWNVAASAEVVFGDFDDSLTISMQKTFGYIDLGNGANNIFVGAETSFTELKSGAGNDIVTFDDTVRVGSINLGAGSNQIYVNSKLTIGSSIILNIDGATNFVVGTEASIADNTLTAVFRNSSANLGTAGYNWTNLMNVQKVRIQVSSDKTFDSPQFTLLLENGIKDFTLKSDKENYVRLQIFDGKNWTTSLFTDAVAPDQVTGLQSVASERTVAVVWDASSDNLGGSGIQYYTVQVASDSDFTVDLKTYNAADTYQLLSSFASGMNYWRVRAVDYAGNIGAWSAVSSFNSDVIPPTNPSDLSVNVDRQNALLKWRESSDHGSGVKEYIVTWWNGSSKHSATTSSTGYLITGLAESGWSWSVQAVDNAGNKSDIVFGRSFNVLGTNTTTVKNDINGNQISDVIFQFTGGDNQIGFWMDGKALWRGQGLAEPADWKVLGAYDMNSNGKADVVMLGNVTVNGVKGAYIGYRKDGDMETWENISYLTNSDNINWNIKIGNVTGNAAKNSIVWHAAELGVLGVWTDGTDNWISLATGFDSNWKMIGTGDFGGNSRDEILFQNGSSFYTTDIDGNFRVLGGLGEGWSVKAIGDFQGDHKEDIILEHEATGLCARLENGLASQYLILGQLDTSDWFICGAGDYDGDGKDDLLVRQHSTGMLGYYSGGDFSKWNEMGRGVDMNWAVIA